jgi:translation elongation factor EF-G
MEPILNVEISVPESYASAAPTLGPKKLVPSFGDKNRWSSLSTPMKVWTAHLPVAQTFGFTGALCAATRGKAFLQRGSVTGCRSR